VDVFKLFLKTYCDDILYVERLLDSFRKFNVEGHGLVLSVPQSDRDLFVRFEGDKVVIVTDEELTNEFLTTREVENLGIHPGAANAGVVKLAFGLSGMADFYLSLDSDMEFIRPIALSDFFDESGRPVLVARSYPELKCDPFYRERYWSERVGQYQQVLSTLRVSDPTHRTCHNTQVMSSDVVKGLHRHLQTLDLTLGGAMSLSPMEYFWYGAWALSSLGAGRLAHGTLVSDLALMVHHQGDHLAYLSKGVRKVDLAESFLGVIVNSNWSRQYGLVDFDVPPIDQYLSRGKWSEWNGRRTSISGDICLGQ